MYVYIFILTTYTQTPRDMSFIPVYMLFIHNMQ